MRRELRRRPRLTHRQEQVLELVAEGLSNSAIATRLRVSVGAVKKHVSRLLLHFGVPSRAALVRAASRSTETLPAKALADLFERAPFMAAVTRGPRHVVEYANDSLFEYIGRRPTLGKEARQVIPGLQPRTLYDVYDRVYASGQPQTVKGFVFRADLRLDGRVEERVVDLLVYPRRGPDRRVGGLIAVAVDVTERARRGMRG